MKKKIMERTVKECRDYKRIYYTWYTGFESVLLVIPAKRKRYVIEGDYNTPRTEFYTEREALKYLRSLEK